MNQQSDTAPQPLAAIDVGSNTIHLVVAHPPTATHPDLTVLVDDLDFVRLGAGVGATGQMAPERIELGLASLKRLNGLATQAGASLVLCAATEVLRLAANGADFLARAWVEVGLDIPIISGDQEAAFTFWGATSGRQLARRQPVAVGDLGGGSLELVLGSGQRLAWRTSLPLGSGALHDRFFQSDPPTSVALEQAQQHARAVLDAQPLPTPAAPAHQKLAPAHKPSASKAPAHKTPLLIVCGGTATTLLSVMRRALGVSEQTRQLTRDELQQALALLSALRAEEIAARYGVDVERARILCAGTVVLAALLDHLGASAMQVSQRGIREGMILAWARQGTRWLAAAAQGKL
jgi:exopolyphosphatase/guanosine-5'-triphosphate,3'-diphosphate pyrophosphatase